MSLGQGRGHSTATLIVVRGPSLPAREQFAAVLSGGPLLRSDAIVVLAGEDGEERAKAALELFRQEAAPTIVLSGGVQDAPWKLSAEALVPVLCGLGVARDRLMVEGASQNTREQAVNVVALAVKEGWRQLLLVASPYHVMRAALTFIQALTDAGQQGAIRIVAVPCAHLRWWGAPPGMTDTRLGLLAWEVEKTERYQAEGHAASYEAGIAYLKSFEGR